MKRINNLTALLYLGGSALFSGLIVAFAESWLTIPFGIFYALLPGLLILALVRRPLVPSWTTFLLSIGLGITTFTFLALAVNTAGLILGLEQPLNLTTLIVANFILIALLSTGMRRWQIEIPTQRSPLTLLERGLISLGILLVISFILGAISLNNASDGWLSFACFAIIPIIFIVIFWLHNQIRGSVIITTLWLIGLGLLLSGWLRSWHITGPDVSLEYRLAEIVSTNNLWSLETIKHAYNACLSVSLFAPALSLITKSTIALTFKFIIPLLYSFIVPIAYLITRRFFERRGAILAAAFFMAQPVFVVWWWIPIRQQIAFLLFGVILLIATEFRQKIKGNLALLLVLSLGLVVAHYTTALLAITYFIIVWVIAILLGRNRNFKNFRSPIPLGVIIVLIATYFIWYAQMTYGFSGVTTFVSKSLNEVGQLVTGGGGGGSLSQLNIFSTQKQSGLSFDQYAAERSSHIRKNYGEKNMYSKATTQQHPIAHMPSEDDSQNVIQKIRQAFISLSKVLVVIGVGVALWLALKRGDSKMAQYSLLSVSALTMLAVTVVLPSFSVSYDLVRTYQQLLFAMAGIFSLAIIVPTKYKTLASYSIMMFVALYFILASNTLSYLTNSPTIPANLANHGNEHRYRYVYRSDVLAGQWIAHSTSRDSSLSGDGLARDRLRPILDPNRSQAIVTTVLPQALPKSGYVIKNTRSNEKNAYDTFESSLFIYTYPTPFLNANKNLVYSNPGAHVYR